MRLPLEVARYMAPTQSVRASSRVARECGDVNPPLTVRVRARVCSAWNADAGIALLVVVANAGGGRDVTGRLTSTARLVAWPWSDVGSETRIPWRLRYGRVHGT
ncbi:MAG: hypothetical protein ACKO2L_12685 [Planctomycetaceae bacterium]